MFSCGYWIYALFVNSISNANFQKHVNSVCFMGFNRRTLSVFQRIAIGVSRSLIHSVLVYRIASPANSNPLEKYELGSS